MSDATDKKAEKEARRAQFVASNPALAEKEAAKKQQQTAATTADANDAAAAKKADKEARRAQFVASNPKLAEKEAAKKQPQQQQHKDPVQADSSASATTAPPATTAAAAAASSSSGQQQPQQQPPSRPLPAHAVPESLAQLRPLSVAPPFGGGGGSFPPSSSTAGAVTGGGDDTTTTHPRVAAVGALFGSRCIVGGNARLLATLDALCIAACSFAESHAVSGGMRVLQNLSAYLRYNIRFLESCRPFTSGMKQVTDRLMRHLGTMPELSVRALEAVFAELRTELLEAVAYTAAGAASVVQEGDVIVTYGRSSAIEMALCNLCERNNSAIRANKASKRQQMRQQRRNSMDSIATSATGGAAGPAAGSVGNSGTSPIPPTIHRIVNFSVVIVDSAPLFEGRALLKKLREAGAPSVTYCLLDACVMATHRATKVFLGASALMPNGQVLGRAGTAMVAMAARYCRKPVFAVCESYKFTANMWQGSLTFNQQDNTLRRTANPRTPTLAVPYSAAANQEHQQQQQQGSNLLYDLTPPGTVQFVVSEHEVHEPTAIAAVVRLRQN